MLTAKERETTAGLGAASLILSSLFVLMGALMLAGLAAWVLSTESLFTTERTVEAITWNFARTVGFIRPLLLIAGAGGLFSLAGSLRRYEIGAARWAVLIFSWLVAAAAVMIALNPLLRWLSPAIPADQKVEAALQAALPFVVALVVLAALRWVVVHYAAEYKGEENINSRNTRRAWNLLVPLLIVFMVIAISPLEQVFVTSLTNERFASSQEGDYIGLQNYLQLWSVRLDTVPCNTDDAGACLVDADGNIDYPRPRRFFPADSPYNELRYRDVSSFDLFGTYWVISARDPEFLSAMVTSIYYTFLAIILQFAIGFLMAMIIAQRTRGIGIMRVVMLVPMAIPTLIASQFWEVMLRSDQTGLINSVLLAVGAIQQPQNWLLDSTLQVPTLVAVIVWKETPITALLLLPGLLAIPREVYQAAAIDGANRLQRFWTITLPIMRPTIGVVLVLRTMIFLRVFDLFDILVGRNRFVMATYAHDVLIQRQQLGYSSAVSVTIFVITMIFTIAYMRTLRIDEA
jgi:trehalose/maltose transport system permease protein